MYSKGSKKYFPLPFLFLSLSFLPVQPPARVDRQIDRQPLAATQYCKSRAAVRRVKSEQKQ